MKTCKKLLAITIALVLLVSTLVSGLVVSAKEAGTLVLTSQPITESDADTKATVDLTFKYGEPGVVAPHKFITISTDPTFVLEDVVVASVNGKAASEYGTETDGDGENAIILNPCPVYIEKDGINTSKGLVLLESKLDENTYITDVVITATYKIPANTEAKGYPVTVTADYTDYYECDDTLDITNGEIVIEAAHKHAAKDLVNNEDGTHTVKCECGETIETVKCVYENGECACGAKEPVKEPVLDESLNLTFSCGLGDTAYISCVLPTAQFSKYASYEVVFTRNTSSGSDRNFKEIVTTIDGSENVISGANAYCYYYGIELYSLMIPVDVVVNCKDAEGNVVAYSKTFTTTLKDALAANYAKTSNVKLKKAITDCINAGTEVQKFFTAGKTCDYANLPLPNEGWDQTYATTELGALATYNTPNNGAVTIAAGAAVGEAPYLSFNMAGISASEASQYTIKMSYYNANQKKDVVVELPLTDESVLLSAGKYYAYFRSMAIYATNAEVTAEIYKAGNDTPISTYSYCFDAFVNANKNHAKMGNALVALAKLGQSFRALKGI